MFKKLGPHPTRRLLASIQREFDISNPEAFRRYEIVRASIETPMQSVLNFELAQAFEYLGQNSTGKHLWKVIYRGYEVVVVQVRDGRRFILEINALDKTS